jgi:hypothetical protein
VPRISLTDLVDIVSLSGSPKATRVAEAKKRADYKPAFDFYKPLREHIVSTHKDGGNRGDLDSLMPTIRDSRKKGNFPEAIKGYSRWWGRKDLSWFRPSRMLYAKSGIEVIVNPELGLSIDGHRHLVKLYFKDERLSKLRVDVITALMEEALRAGTDADVAMSVLDVRRAKLFTVRPATVHHAVVMAEAELAYIAALWPHL